MRSASFLTTVLLTVALVSGCTSWDERQGHVCGDSPDAVCDEDDAKEAASEGPDRTVQRPSERWISSRGGDPPNSEDCAGTEDAAFPTVVWVGVFGFEDGTASVSVTLCSAYDTPERYADAWRVLTVDGNVLAVRELAHDHADEQPFNRSLTEPITIPAGVTSVVIEGRDLENGWGGETLEVDLSE